MFIGFFSTIVFALGADVLGQKLRKNSNLTKWHGKVVGSIYSLLGAKLAMQD
jgi:threonine/homoserine/homoserine lactone efflux protein